MEEKIEIPIPEEYSDICPISDAEFQAKMALMVKEPGFEHAIRYVMHDVDFDAFCQGLMAIKSKNEFQIKIMQPFLAMLEAKTTNGISWGGLENLNKDTNYTFITNHRDIVLDASFMNVALLRGGFDSTEVAIGNNLLILDWIETLVRLNKCFIVKRDNSIKQALESAIQLSSYIHFCINKKHESVWIAQREGRCKDSNDLTQESLIKMLGIAGLLHVGAQLGDPLRGRGIHRVGLRGLLALLGALGVVGLKGSRSDLAALVLHNQRIAPAVAGLSGSVVQLSSVGAVRNLGTAAGGQRKRQGGGQNNGKCFFHCVLLLKEICYKYNIFRREVQATKPLQEYFLPCFHYFLTCRSFFAACF